MGGGVQTGVVPDLSYAYIRLYLSYTGLPDGSQLTHVGTSAGAAQDEPLVGRTGRQLALTALKVGEEQQSPYGRLRRAGCLSFLLVSYLIPLPLAVVADHT